MNEFEDVGDILVERIEHECHIELPQDVINKTGGRFVHMLREMTAGYAMNPKHILSATFDGESYDEMVTLGSIPFWSLCEHHLVPFHGNAWISYIPARKRVIGLSKMARLVECYSRRLQLQERMTQQIADALLKYLDPIGVGVMVKGRHLCMEMRGVRTRGETVTTALSGKYRTDPQARSEFLSMVGR